MKAATVVILIASLSLPAGLAAKGLVERQIPSASFVSTSSVMDSPFADVKLPKTSRLPLEHQPSHDEQSALGDDGSSEWALDCYDAYGADGEEANQVSLQACLKG
ncbi:hypothetical protein ACQZ61_20660 [Agrobacterium vitis]|uniref:hypothetical protein n=1 Tax=Agrobacterium vitis TaxID=373 RepID=UPI0015DB09FB|nr:hypothetical protein [Agrobacterium vitis]MCF1454805.1 hypothetical protein [Agrobacterium vitis]MCF1468557.1 hypothetical protein [Agrobacterium vitis]